MSQRIQFDQDKKEETKPTMNRIGKMMSMIRMMRLMLKTASLVVLLVSHVESSGFRKSDRAIRIMNDSGSRVELFWINPSTGEGTLMSKPHIYDGATFPLNSYVGHEFEVREMPSTKTGRCKNEDQVCRIGNFKVSENDEQAIRILPGFQVVFADSLTTAQESATNIIDDCQQKAHENFQNSDKSTEASIIMINQMADCVEHGVKQKVQEIDDEITYQGAIRKNIANTLERYVCKDDKFPMTDDLISQSWTNEQNQWSTHIKHDRPSSQIHVIENFITDDECNSDTQAPQLQQRALHYANHILGIGLEAGGQENLIKTLYNQDNIHQYNTFHCDGDCTGAQHQVGARVATLIMYCSNGPIVNFRNAGVRVRPDKGNAIFVSYMNTNTMQMDSGFTEYSACPPEEGGTKLLIQHIRFGVDEEKPWNMFH